MKKMYCIMWDNGEQYDDHCWNLIAFYTTREEADKHIAYIKSLPVDEDAYGYGCDTYEVIERELCDKFIPKREES